VDLRYGGVPDRNGPRDVELLVGCGGFFPPAQAFMRTKDRLHAHVGRPLAPAQCLLFGLAIVLDTRSMRASTVGDRLCLTYRGARTWL